jgi:catechol 2,3-dioxygenase-like lactoylglutathione lyase family enzyme
VSDLHERVAVLRHEGIRFHLEPIHAEGDVDLTFFYDPDGTLLELVEGDLQYHEVYDQKAVDADWALGAPARPRFDHVAETVHDLADTVDHYSELGYIHMAGIHQPNDPRGYEIDFLRSGDSSLEIFTFSDAEKTRRVPQLDAAGFLAVEFTSGPPRGSGHVGLIGADAVARVDPDGLVQVVATGG